MKNPGFKTIEGRKPILLSSPHVYPHKRPNLNMVYKKGEPFTDTIVEEICKRINISGIIQTEETDYDPNYIIEKRNPYKQKVREIVKTNDTEYFIDIHGLKDVHKYDVAIYYPSKFFKSIKLANDIKEGLDKGNLRGINIVILRFPENNQKTLGNFVASKLRVPSIQIEVARYIRENDQLIEHFISNLSSVLKGMVV